MTTINVAVNDVGNTRSNLTVIDLLTCGTINPSTTTFQGTPQPNATANIYAIGTTNAREFDVRFITGPNAGASRIITAYSAPAAGIRRGHRLRAAALRGLHAVL